MGADLDEIRSLIARSSDRDTVDLEADARLQSLVEFPPEPWPSFRVTVITRNRLMPPEWRHAAWTTLLPDEAAEALDRWQGWYRRARTGQLRHYLARIAAIDAAEEVELLRDHLVSTAAATVGRSNAWALKESFVAARDTVLALPKAPSPPGPGRPPMAGVRDVPATGQAEAIAALRRHIDQVRAAARDFNRRVPQTLKVRVWDIALPVAGEAHDRWLEEFFDWARPYADSGQGFWLWR